MSIRNKRDGLGSSMSPKMPVNTSGCFSHSPSLGCFSVFPWAEWILFGYWFGQVRQVGITIPPKTRTRFNHSIELETPRPTSHLWAYVGGSSNSCLLADISTTFKAPIVVTNTFFLWTSRITLLLWIQL